MLVALDCKLLPLFQILLLRKKELYELDLTVNLFDSFDSCEVEESFTINSNVCSFFSFPTLS